MQTTGPFPKKVNNGTPALKSQVEDRDKQMRILAAKVAKMRSRLKGLPPEPSWVERLWIAALEARRSHHWLRFENYRQYLPRDLKLESFRTHKNAAEPERLPSISLVTPSYNHSQFINATINSVLRQNYPKLQFIVQDGASTDGTVAILEKRGNEGFEWDSSADTGQTQAINRGFERSTGEVMGWLNSDDMLMPGSLHHVGRLFVEHPDIDVIYGYRVCIDEAEKEIGRWMFPDIHGMPTLKVLDLIPQETLFWRRRAWNEIGSALDESLQFAMDWDFLLKLANSQARFLRTPYFTGMFRVHSSQKSSALIGSVGKSEMNILRERYGGGKINWRLFDHEFARASRGGFLRAVLHDKFGWRL